MDTLPEELIGDIVSHSSMQSLLRLSNSHSYFRDYLSKPSILRQIARDRGLPLAATISDLARYDNLSPSGMLSTAVSLGDKRVIEELFADDVAYYDSDLLKRAVIDSRDPEVVSLVFRYAKRINIATVGLIVAAADNLPVIEVLMDNDVEFTLGDLEKLPSDVELFKQLMRISDMSRKREVLIEACSRGFVDKLPIPDQDRQRILNDAIVSDCEPLVRSLIRSGVIPSVSDRRDAAYSAVPYIRRLKR